jgi:hypothetical protein
MSKHPLNKVVNSAAVDDWEDWCPPTPSPVARHRYIPDQQLQATTSHSYPSSPKRSRPVGRDAIPSEIIWDLDERSPTPTPASRPCRRPILDGVTHGDPTFHVEKPNIRSDPVQKIATLVTTHRHPVRTQGKPLLRFITVALTDCNCPAAVGTYAPETPPEAIAAYHAAVDEGGYHLRLHQFLWPMFLFLHMGLPYGNRWIDMQT